MYESIVFCSACTMSSVSKFTFAISSPDEFLVRQALDKQAERQTDGMQDVTRPARGRAA